MNKILKVMAFSFLMSALSADVFAVQTFNFSLCDSTFNGAAFDCSTPPNNLDVLSFNGFTNKWSPRSPSFTTVKTGVTSNYEVTRSDSVVTVDTTTSNVTVTLPTAAGIAGKIYTIKKSDSSLNKITIVTTSSEIIDGRVNYLLYLPNQFVTVVSDDSGWNVINSTGPLTKCPTGMSLFGKGRNTFCIENVVRAAANYVNANNTCFAAGMGLCEYNQWVIACNAGAPFIPTTGGEWGKESYTIAGAATLYGMGTCDNNNSNFGYVNNPIAYRCCVR